MQVVHQNKHATHAVIGGGEVIEMQTSSSAEFIHIMASSIYKDQKLAVAREVLCNAWDAHIEANVMHLAVEVTLTPEKLIIRDFGKGIHHEDMGPVYGVFGNSTKKRDGRQTGGFGLGCKAPYAYVDHFEVISMHDGIRTVYNLSKSSAAAMGKPAIVPIVSFPTVESGLQVSIDILSAQDHARFERLIRRIARNGDMNVNINGEPVKKLGMAITNGAYLLTKENSFLDTVPPIMIRYGNVIYPVERSGDIAVMYDKVNRHLNKLQAGNDQYHIIFQAPAHSIAVQPSREGLSMQPHTVATVNTLMSDFIKTLNEEFLVECEKVAKTTVDGAVADVQVQALLDTKEKLPYKGMTYSPFRIEDLGNMARRYMEANYPTTLEFRKRDLTYRVRKMAEGGLIQRGLAQTFIKAMKKVKTRHVMGREDNTWLQRQIIGPLATKMQSTSLKLERLYVYDADDQNAPRSAYNRNLPPFIPATSASPKHLFMALPYLRNIVVLSTTKKDMFDRARRHDTFKELGQNHGFIFYHVGMKKADKQDAQAFFQSTGMEIVDLTELQEWEQPQHFEIVNTPVVAAPRKPKKVGLPCLSGIKDDKRIKVSKLLNDDIKRITDPEFIVYASTKQGEPQQRIGRFEHETSNYIVDLFGDKGAITNNSAAQTKAIHAGASHAEDYIRSKVCVFMVTNPNIAEFWQYHPKRAMFQAEISHFFPKDLLKVIYRSPVLRAQYNLVNNLTPEEIKYLMIWQDIFKQQRYNNMTDDVRAVSNYLDDIPVHQANLDLIEKMQTSKVLPIVDRFQLAQMVRDNPSDSDAAKTAIKILSLALT